MKYSRHLLAALLAFTVLGTGCKNYATVRDRKPTFASTTPAGEKIVQALKHPVRTPEVQMGRFIDAASMAGKVLEKYPQDTKALRDYNFAVSRLFDVLDKSDLKPWRAPVICPGAEGNWSFTVLSDGKPEHDPSNFRIMAADRFQFRGTLVRERSVKDGLGAPMVIASKGFDPTRHDPFIQGKNVYYGITQILRFNGRRVTAAYVDPLATEEVKFAGHTFPVAADFTAPIALALAELRPRRHEIKRMFNPEAFAASTRLARLQPYDPKKIPVICIHGLGDSQATWAPMIESLRGDATIRKNYQFWFFSYPTGYPYPLMASVLREQLKAMKATYPDHKKMVVVGHSMGGMIARSLITDSGLNLWNAYFDTPPDQTNLPEETLQIMKGALVFQPHPDISRVIFASASLRGSDMATNIIGRLGSKLIGSPSVLLDGGQEALRLAKPSDVTGNPITRMPNSVDALDPENRYLLTINALPLAPGIPYHSIIGDRGKGGNLNHVKPVSTDGIVPYWSSHLDGAQSELIVPSDHWSNQNPQAIAEVNRILKQHLGAAAR